MFCQQCGNQIEEGMAFCTNCGAKQATQNAAPANNQAANAQQSQPYINPQQTQQTQQAQPNPQYTQPNNQYTQPNNQYAQPNNQYAQPNNQYAQPNQYNQPVNQQNYNQYNQYNPNANANASESPKNVSFGEAIKLFFVNYVNFTGRSTVSEYWFAYLFNFLVGLCLGWIPVVGTLISLGLLIPGLSLGVRRLHDTGKSWVYMLMGLIPLAGFIILIVQYCKPSDADNQWGPAARN